MSVQSDAKSAEAIDQSIIKEHINYLNSMHDTPAIRLDAEFYQVDDIDGATEGVTGSGNLNYLVLQSQQTNESSLLNNPFDVMKGGDITGSDVPGGTFTNGDASTRGFGNSQDDDNGMSMAGHADDIFSVGGLGNTGSDIPAMGAGIGAGVSTLKARGFTGGGDFNYENDIDITNPPSPPEEPPEEPPVEPPEEPPVNDDVDLTVDIDTPVLDVDLDTVLDPIEDILGDVDIDVDTIIDNILPGDHGLLPDIGASADAVLGGTTLIGTDLSEITGPLDPVISGATNLLDDVIGGVESLLPSALVEPVTSIVNSVLDLTGLGGNPDGDTDLLLNLGAVIPGFNTLETTLDVPLNPVETLLGDIDITVDADALVEDLGDHLFSVANDIHDFDIAGVVNTVIGEGGILQDADGILPQLTVGLDVATDILPDLSENLATDDVLNDAADFAADVLANADVVFPIEDLIGNEPLGSDVLGGLLDSIPGGDDATAPDSDTDLSLDTNVELLGLEAPDLDADVPLDIIESLIGDIDVDIDVNSLTEPESVTDILDGALAGDIDGVLDGLGTDIGLDVNLDLLGGDVIDTVIPDLGDVSGDVAGAGSGTAVEGLGEAVGSLLGGPIVPDVLPDPVGTLTEGLGSVIDTTPVLGGLGGMLGGGGGLFG